MLDFLGNLKRTHYCGALRASDAGGDAVIMGWVHRRRDLGQSASSSTCATARALSQVVFQQGTSQPEAHAKAEEVRTEFVVAVEGKVVKRAEGQSRVWPPARWKWLRAKLHILNNAKTPPFPMEDEINAAKRPACATAIWICAGRARSAISRCATKIVLEMRKAMDELGFYRNRNADADALHAGRRARLPGAQPRASRAVLRAAAIAADFQANSDDRRPGPLFPDRADVSATKICAPIASRNSRSSTWRCLFPRQEDIFRRDRNT